MKKLTFDEYMAAKPGEVVVAVAKNSWVRYAVVVQEKSLMTKHPRIARMIFKLADYKRDAKYYKFTGVEKIDYKDIPKDYPQRNIYVAVSLNPRNSAFKVISLDEARRETRQLWWLKEDDEKFHTMTDDEFYAKLSTTFEKYVDAVLWSWKKNPYTDDKSPSDFLRRGLYEYVLEARQAELEGEEKN